MAAYTYDPTQIAAYGVDRMRFELGDTVTDTGALTSPLCDEEYAAMLAEHPQDWRAAKLACLRAIVMKLSYEVDTNVTGLSYALAQRYDRWKTMLAEEEQRQAACRYTPRVHPNALVSANGGQPYFYHNLHANARACPPNHRNRTLSQDN